MTEDIPAFLLLTVEQRRAAWQRAPPRAMPTFDAPQRIEDPATTKLRVELAAQSRPAKRGPGADWKQLTEDLA